MSRRQSNNPYKPGLMDRFWKAVWLPGREGRQLEEDLHYAATTGNLWRAHLLLKDKKVDIASGDNFAVRWAAAGGHTDMLHLLFAHGGVDVNAKDGEALIRAAARGHHAAAALLVEKGADITRQDFKALREADRRKDTAMIAHLLAAPQDAADAVRALLAAAREEQPADPARLRLYQTYLAAHDPAPPKSGHNNPPPKP